jgi:hypothetical protein
MVGLCGGLEPLPDAILSTFSVKLSFSVRLFAILFVLLTSWPLAVPISSGLTVSHGGASASFPDITLVDWVASISLRGDERTSVSFPEIKLVA